MPDYCLALRLWYQEELLHPDQKPLRLLKMLGVEM